MRHARKEVREVAAILVSLGYRFDRATSGHAVYVKDGRRPFSLPSTPSDSRWRENTLAEIRRRHPELPDQPAQQPRERSRLAAVTQVARAPITSPWFTPAPRPEPAPEPARAVPAPGAPEAVAEGCLCARFKNQHGEGLEGRPGEYEISLRPRCPLHAPLELALDPAPWRICPCGAGIERSTRPGRPRKYCKACRPERLGQTYKRKVAA